MEKRRAAAPVIPFRCVSGSEMHRDAVVRERLYCRPRNRTMRDESSDGVRGTPTEQQSLQRGWFDNKRGPSRGPTH